MTDQIVTLRDFWLSVYGGRAYSIPTLKRRIREGKIPGGYRDEGGRYMVDMAVYNQERFKQLDDIDPVVRRAVGL